ncbi:MAG: hypothetical protein J6S23_04900 [Clostridia bacterium]|nr:hypothetical protein [Clostridia bacterium]
MKKIKNTNIYILIFILLIISSVQGLGTIAFSENIYDFENFTESDAMDFVKQHNIEIPAKLMNWENLASFTRDIIIEAYKNPDMPFEFNYSKTQKYAEDIRSAVSLYVVKRNNTTYTTGSYNLRHNTVMNANGEWVTSGGYYNPDWAKYNCYAYALNRCEMSNFYVEWQSPYDPGDMYYDYDVFGNVDTAEELAEIVCEDLMAMGYTDIACSTDIPSVNSFQELICIRADLPDYHVMRYDLETDAWYHKHGIGAVLKYNYVPSSNIPWEGEWSWEGKESRLNNYYQGDIYFIRYSKNILNASGNSQGINILPNKDVFYEVNIDTSNHYRLRLIAGYEMDYELYNSDFDVVVSDSNTNNVDTCLSLTPGKYYLRINFTSSQSYSGLSASIGVGYDEYNYVNSSTHSSVCSGCGDTITKSHNFICDGSENSLHYEKCTDCGYRANRMSDYQYISINSNQHSKTCTSCSYSITSSHNFVYKNIGDYHILTCTQCGKTSGSAKSHSWVPYTGSSLIIGNCVKCQTCGCLKILNPDDEIIIIMGKKTGIEEETE